jgi:hypothetical protein
MCKEALNWYKLIYKKDVIDYEKMKKSYKALLIVEIEKESEN